MKYLIFLALFTACQISNSTEVKESSLFASTEAPMQDSLKILETAYFASGCFWCVEAIYESVRGVESVISGYAGGPETNPTYAAVSAGKTGHAETVMIYYDPKQIDFATLVDVFFGSHDPTSLNRQGPDSGPQYRSIAFYQDDAEKQIIVDKIAEINASQEYSSPVITEIKEFEVFYPAEVYHQDYEQLNPQNRYVQNISIPRLNKFKKKFPELIKEEEKH